MRTISFALLGSFAIGVAGLSCYTQNLMSDAMPTVTMPCPAVGGFNYCFRQVMTAQGVHAYGYGCDAGAFCSKNGDQNVAQPAGGSKSVWCCNTDNCNTNTAGNTVTTAPAATTVSAGGKFEASTKSAASIGSIVTLIAAANFIH